MPRKLISTSAEKPPFPLRHWAARCCGAVEIDLNREVDASTFLKEVDPIRFYMYLFEDCTLGCFIFKYPLPLDHPLVVEARGKKLKGFHFLPFKDKLFTIYIIEEALPFEIKVKYSTVSSFFGMQLLTVTPELTQLSPLEGVREEFLDKKIKNWSKIYYAVQGVADGGDMEIASAFEKKGFQQFPFNHRVHSGIPRRMLLWVRVPTEADLR